MSIRKRYWGPNPEGKQVRKNKDGTVTRFDHVAFVVDYKDQHGNRALRTFSKEGQAKEFETTMRGEVREKRHVIASKSITVSEAGEEWISAVTHGRGNRGPAEASTLRQYRQHLDTYIKPALGDVKLADLAKRDVITFRDNLLSKQKLSRAMAKKVLTSLKGILSEAVHSDRVVVNVASSVQIGTGGRHKEEVVIPSEADIRAILTKLDELAEQDNRRWAEAWERRRALIVTAIHTGLRASELRGLPWDAVDLKAGKIEVRQRADENGKIGAPKSVSGNRTVYIPSSLVTLLKAHKLKSKHTLVFATEEGTPQSLPNIHNRAWNPVQIAAGVCDPKKDEKGNVIRDEDGKPIMEPRYNFHSLRHYHASVLIADGTDFKEIQTEMGHSSINITIDLYGHPIEGEEADRARKQRADRLAEKLSRR